MTRFLRPAAATAALSAFLFGATAASACEAHRAQATAQLAQASGHQHHGAVPAAQGALVVSAAWSRATPPGAKVGAGYLTVENRGTVPDRLTGGRFDVAGAIEVHEMSMAGGTMTMRALEKGLEIAPGGKAELKPGGMHLMLIDLKRPLKQGETLRGELTFEKAGAVSVEFTVEAIGARAPADSHAGHGGQHKH